MTFSPNGTIKVFQLPLDIFHPVRSTHSLHPPREVLYLNETITMMMLLLMVMVVMVKAVRATRKIWIHVNG